MFHQGKKKMKKKKTGSYYYLKVNRENKTFMQSILLAYIIVCQLGVFHSFILQTNDIKILNSRQSKSQIEISDSQINSPGIIHNISESEKVNDMLGIKAIFCFNTQGETNIKINRNIISYLPVSNALAAMSGDRYNLLNPRSPPSYKS